MARSRGLIALDGEDAALRCELLGLFHAEKAILEAEPGGDSRDAGVCFLANEVKAPGRTQARKSNAIGVRLGELLNLKGFQLLNMESKESPVPVAALASPQVERWLTAKLNPAQKFLTKDELRRLPALYGTEHIPLAEKKAIVHFFGGAYDFWAVEFDPSEGRFWGFARIGGHGEGKWGYVTAEELLAVTIPLVVRGLGQTRLHLERDLHFDGSLPEAAN